MRPTIARTLFALTLAAASAATARAQQSEAELKPADLAGGYEIVSGEKFGVAEPAERIKGTTVRFTEDRVVVMDKDSKEVYGATYTLEPAEAAKEEANTGATAAKIRMTSKLADAENQVALGLIDREGDTVRLVYAIPGGEVPKEFKTKPKQMMFVMKKKAS